jgi:hypothetical protein
LLVTLALNADSSPCLNLHNGRLDKAYINDEMMQPYSYRDKIGTFLA